MGLSGGVFGRQKADAEQGVEVGFDQGLQRFFQIGGIALQFGRKRLRCPKLGAIAVSAISLSVVALMGVTFYLMFRKPQSKKGR